MGTPFSLNLTLASPRETAALAQKLAPRLGPGDVLLLEGPIGAGKSHFARALILARLAAAGRSEDVPSPTYTLVQTYDDGKCEIWHADLYRLCDVSEVEELGLTEAFATAICLVEWPDRLGSLAPAEALHADFALAEQQDARHLSLSSQSPLWAERLSDV